MDLIALGKVIGSILRTLCKYTWVFLSVHTRSEWEWEEEEFWLAGGGHRGATIVDGLWYLLRGNAI